MAFQVKKFESIIASMINWVSGATNKITDFNVGSVSRTILEAVAMELEELYYQLLQATEEAIEEAIYRTFNFPRNPAIRTTGIVRFTRLIGAEVIITIPINTLVATSSDPPIIFETQVEEVIPYFTGTATGGGTTSLIDTTKNFVNEGVIIGSTIINVTDGGQTQPAGVTSITTTTNPNDTLNFGVLTNGANFSGGGDLYKIIVPYKDVSVQALVPGIDGNVAANLITVLKSNVSNVQSVANSSVFTNGLDEETDLRRKARFALYIQSLAKATKGALEYAARTVDQIVAAKAIDDIRPIVFVYDAGSDVYTDITSAMRNPGDAAVNLFPLAEDINDCLFIGGSELYEYINIHLTQVGVIFGTLPIWEYYSDTGWKDLSAVSEFNDGTNSGSGPLTQSGTLSFTPPNDWIAVTINGKLRMWIRLRIAASGVTYSQNPTGDWCSLPPGFGYVNLYCHDGSGELSSILKASVENVVELYRGAGIMVNVEAPIKIQPTIIFEVTVAANYDAEDITNDSVQAVIDFLNAKILGEDLYLAELYQLIMGVNDKAILNVDISAPINDIIIPSSGVLKANPTLITATWVQ